MYESPQSNQLNTVAVRVPYILPILKRFPRCEPRKTGEWVVYLFPEITKTETSLSFSVLE